MIQNEDLKFDGNWFNRQQISSGPKNSYVVPPTFAQFNEMAVGTRAGANEFEQVNGWPFWCLEGFGVITYDRAARNQISPLQGGHLWFIDPPKRPGDTYKLGGILPLCPIWPGFAINTIFYTAISWGVWLLFAVPGRLRRWRRIRRGACAACGHLFPPATLDNSKGSDVCTECGSQGGRVTEGRMMP